MVDLQYIEVEPRRATLHMMTLFLEHTLTSIRLFLSSTISNDSPMASRSLTRWGVDASGGYCIVCQCASGYVAASTLTSYPILQTYKLEAAAGEDKAFALVDSQHNPLRSIYPSELLQSSWRLTASSSRRRLR